MSKDATSSKLNIKTQAQAAAEFIENIEGKASGQIPTFRTEYAKLNEFFGGGIETNTILTLAGASGGGKSTISELISYSIHKETATEGWEVVGLNINLEMLSLKTFGRIVARESRTESTRLYSISDTLTQEEIDNIKEKIIPYLSRFKIYYLEETGTAAQLLKAIYDFWEKYVKTPPNSKVKRLMVVQLDHTLLVKGDDNNSKLDELMQGLKDLKKLIASKGGHALYIILSQLNRNIQAKERITNPALHRPDKADIYGSEACYQNSDYVVIAHNPRRLGLEYYTPAMLPVKGILKETGEEVDFIYFESIKNREGRDGLTTSMIAYFKYFTLVEMYKHEMDEYTQLVARGKPILMSKAILESRIKSLDPNYIAPEIEPELG